MPKILFFFYSVLLFTNHAYGENYTLGAFTFSLPIPSQWQVKNKSTANTNQGSLVFFDSTIPAPRPIISVYFSSFSYPQTQKDLTAFKEKYLTQKNASAKKNSGKMLENPTLEYFEKQQTAIGSSAFKNAHGEFFELARYQQCDKEFSLVLKMIIPYGIWKDNLPPHNHDYWRNLAQISLCTKSHP